MNKYYLRYLGDPVLKTKSASVLDLKTIPTDLISEMVNLFIAEKALGLAAPQLGVPLRIVILRLGDQALVAVNPSAVELTGESVYDQEGCLSIPGFFVQVPRYPSVKFHYTTPTGTYHTTLTGMEARVAQHEFDHLDGKMIIDYCSRQQRRQAERMVMAKFPSHYNVRV